MLLLVNQKLQTNLARMVFCSSGVLIDILTSLIISIHLIIGSKYHFRLGWSNIKTTEDNDSIDEVQGD